MPQTRATSRQNQSSATENDSRLTDMLLTMNMLYQTHIHPLLPEPLKPVSNYISSLIISASPFLTQFIALFRAVISSASSLATNQQDGSAILSLGVLLITLYMGLRIMNYIRRTIMGWIWLGVKMIIVLFIVQLGYYVNQYGWERAAKDAGWIGGIAWGMLEDFMNESQGSQQRQPRGTRRRGQNNYDRSYNDYTYGQRAGRGRYG